MITYNGKNVWECPCGFGAFDFTIYQIHKRRLEHSFREVLRQRCLRELPSITEENYFVVEEVRI